MKDITIIAHRGGPINYPEQTLAAAKESLDLGADLIELDVRFTKDNWLAVSHDKNTMRVFGKNFNINEITASHYYNLFRSGENSAFRGHLLDDFLKDRCFPMLVHVKEGGEAHLKKILAQVERFSVQPRTVYGLESVEDIATMKNLVPDCEVLAFIPSLATLDTFLATEADYIRLWEAWITTELLDKIHSKGKKVWIMTGECNGRPVGECDEETLNKIMNMDIDGILINDIRKVLK